MLHGVSHAEDRVVRLATELGSHLGPDLSRMRAFLSVRSKVSPARFELARMREPVSKVELILWRET